MMRMAWRLVACAVGVGAAVFSVGSGLAAGPAGAGGKTNPKHFFWASDQGRYAGSGAQTNANQLLFHGGAVEQKPSVYIVYWGPEWQQGFTTKDVNGRTFTSAQAQHYINTFFGAVGGSAWGGVQTQYCQNVPVGTVDCTQYPYAQFVTNPRGQLHGAWVDPAPVPSEIVTLGLAENLVQDPIAAEATRAAQHFGYDPNATYFVFTPPGHGATAYGSVYCAYHSQTTVGAGAHGIQYAFLPWLNDYPAGCGENKVNQSSDSFGHGVFDSFSIVAGHEYAEAVTDPDNFFSFQDGWNDAQTNENGDKCAWTGLQNVPMNGRTFAVQPMWTNEAAGGAGGCAVHRGA
jgi:hypothetical protein